MKRWIKRGYGLLVWGFLYPKWRALAYRLPAWERLDKLIVLVEYFRLFKRFPDLVHPKRFNEKIQHRKLYDRNPLLTQLQDKYRARDYVTARVGEQYLAKNYLATDNPGSIDFSALPEQFVLKANHGCGWNIFIKDKLKVDPVATRIQIENWLGENYYFDYWLEWAYKDIKPLVLAEEYLGAETNEFPMDYKFRCFDGVAQILLITQTLKPSGYIRWGTYEFQNSRWVKINRPVYRGEQPADDSPDPDRLPANIAEMTAVAQKLAEGIDYVRVDMFNLGGRIVFGEFTLYDGGGYLPLQDEFDFAWGQKWKLTSQLPE